MTDRDWARRILITLSVLLAVGLPLALAAYAVQLLLLLFLALLLALGLRALGRVIERHTPLPFTPALWVGIVGLALILAGLAAFVGPRITEQSRQFADALPRGLSRLQASVERLPMGNRLVERANSSSLLDKNVLSRIGSFVTTALGAVGNLVLLTALTLFLAAGLETYRRGFLLLVPPGGRKRAATIMDRMGHTLERWLAGRLIDMAILFLLTWLGLALLGVPLAFTLALLAGLLGFVPNIGPIVAFAPAFLVALSQGGRTALWVTLLYIAIQTIESYVLLPFIQRRAVKIPPVLLLMVQLMLGLALGLLGLLLATPLTAVCMTAVTMLYREDLLGEKVESGE